MGERKCEVTEDHCCRHPEVLGVAFEVVLLVLGRGGDVDRGAAPARRGMIEDVVVDECCRLDELDCGAELRDVVFCRVVEVARGRERSRAHEHGA